MLVEYEIEFWDDIEQHPETEKGIGTGATIGDAVNRICSYYGKENVTSIKVSELNDILSFHELLEIINQK